MASVPRDLSCWTNSSSKSLLLSGFLATPMTMILAGRVWYDGSFQTEVSCVEAHAVTSMAMRINKPNGLRSDRIIFCSSFSSMAVQTDGQSVRKINKTKKKKNNIITKKKKKRAHKL